MSKKKIICLLLAVTLFSAALSAAVTSFGIRNLEMERERRDKYEQFSAMAKLEKSWILSCQLPDGAILHEPFASKRTGILVPYFSNQAAIGLLSGPVSKEAADGARAYISWYLDHLNTEKDDPVNGDGTIYDYRLTEEDGTVRLESKDSADSVDAYSATFLILASRYAERLGTKLLSERWEDVVRVIHAMLRTIDENGLSRVSLENETNYLMDNCEVYGGLLAADTLLGHFEPEGELRDRVREAAGQLREQVQSTLWNPKTGSYYVGSLGGRAISADETDFYPDATCQLFPIVYGLLDPRGEQAAELYGDFCDHWDWEHMEHYYSEESDFYWCMLSYVAVVMGDEPRLENFLTEYYRNLLNNGRTHPFYVGEAGWMAMSFGALEELYAAP